MKTALIGYTGFVGTNINNQNKFTKLYNTRNINEIVGEDFGLIVNAGVRAVVWIANQNPEEDLNAIKDLTRHIKKTRTKFIVQISTVDVYPTPIGQDEDSEINMKDLKPYGKNRLWLEQWVESEYPNNHLIIRLPALFGQGLKKNFLYDLIYRVPPILQEDTYNNLRSNLSKVEIELLDSCYKLTESNTYNLAIGPEDKNFAELKKLLLNNSIDSLNFTNSKSEFQFYDLKDLWNHIQICLQNNLNLVNLVTEPISAHELAKKIFKIDFINQNATLRKYNIKTKYSSIFGGKTGYIKSKEEVFHDLISYVNMT